tara:strand:- start:2026 stop:2460 length:435 start_codon:yes stop_codon:yes gene_type:complete
MTNQYISEIFANISKAKTRSEKKTILLANKSNSTFRFILQGTFDPSVEWTVPTIPKFKGSDKPLELTDMNLFASVPKCSIFVKGHPKSAPVKLKKAKEILNEILEMMHKDESTIFAGMLKKKQKCKGLTEKLVLEVFPDLYRKV